MAFHLIKNSLCFNSVYLIGFKSNNSLVYKYFCTSENKSVLNGTFCQLLSEEPNYTKMVLTQ